MDRLKIRSTSELIFHTLMKNALFFKDVLKHVKTQSSETRGSDNTIRVRAGFLLLVLFPDWRSSAVSTGRARAVPTNSSVHRHRTEQCPPTKLRREQSDFLWPPSAGRAFVFEPNGFLFACNHMACLLPGGPDMSNMSLQNLSFQKCLS